MGEYEEALLVRVRGMGLDGSTVVIADVGPVFSVVQICFYEKAVVSYAEVISTDDLAYEKYLGNVVSFPP